MTTAAIAGVSDGDRARSSACGAVVLTTGTFLRGLIHIGEEKIAGRAASARRRPLGLSADPGPAWALPLGRLKTGTPPRLDGRTIDWAGLERQPGDDPPVPFSYLTDRDRRRRRSPATSPRPRRPRTR